MFKSYGGSDRLLRSEITTQLDSIKSNSIEKLNAPFNVYIDPVEGQDIPNSPLFRTLKYAFDTVSSSYYPNINNIVFNLLDGDHVVEEEFYLIDFNTAGGEASRVVLAGKPNTRIILRGAKARFETVGAIAHYIFQDLTFVGESETATSETNNPNGLRVIKNSSVEVVNCTYTGEFDIVLIAANFGYIKQAGLTFNNLNCKQIFFVGNGGKIDFNQAQSLRGSNISRDCAIEIMPNGSIFVGNDTSFQGNLQGKKYRITQGAAVEIIEPSFSLESFPGSEFGEIIEQLSAIAIFNPIYKLFSYFDEDLGLNLTCETSTEGFGVNGGNLRPGTSMRRYNGMSLNEEQSIIMPYPIVVVEANCARSNTNAGAAIVLYICDSDGSNIEAVGAIAFNQYNNTLATTPDPTVAFVKILIPAGKRIYAETNGAIVDYPQGNFKYRRVL